MSRTPQTLTPEQAALLQRGKDSYAAFSESIDDTERKVIAFREQLAREQEATRIRWVQAAYAMAEAGIAKTRIARDVMGHTGTTAAYAAIEEGERYAAPVAEPGDAKTLQIFERAGDSIVFTPTPDSLAPILERLGLEADAVPSDGSATFTVDAGIITPVTPALLPSGAMNPIVAMVMADGSKHARALVEFAEASA